MGSTTQYSIDSRSFRQALGHYASGITVIGGIVEGAPIGFTCQSFYSVSMEPPLISFSVSLGSKSWPVIRKTSSFSVSVLSHDQGPVSEVFASPVTDRWASVDWDRTRSGNPIIKGSLLWLDCDLHKEFEVGDHWIVIGYLKELRTHEETDAKGALLYFKGRYCSLSANS